jgi:hypothetical protein
LKLDDQVEGVPTNPRRPADEPRRATTTETSVTHVPGSKCHPCSGWTERNSQDEQESSSQSKGAARPSGPNVIGVVSGFGGGRSSQRLAQARSSPGETRRLRQRDRELVAFMGVCRYLTARQLVELQHGPKTEKAAEYRLRSLSGEATHSKVRAIEPALTRALPFRAFDGSRMRLWALTPAGYAVAGNGLGRLLKVPRVDVGAAFAEHSAFLTDLFVQLVRPFVRDRTRPRDLPFRWDVADDVELPWKEHAAAGEVRSRVLRPDAVLEVPEAKRRVFIECETGTHTLTPLSAEKTQATVRKLERYDTYVSAFADPRARATHYQTKYPDGWPPEVLFLVQSASRRRSTNEALVAARQTQRTHVLAGAFTLEEAVHYIRRMLPSVDAPRRRVVELAPRRAQQSEDFYGEAEHRAVNEFVIDMTGALASANSRLRSIGLPAVAEPASRSGMVAFLRRAQQEMQRQRFGAGSHG